MFDKKLWRKQNYLKNKQKILDCQSKYNSEHREERLEYQKKYRKLHKEKLNKYNLEYYYLHKETILQKVGEYSKKNKTKISERRKLYRKKNREKIAAFNRLYRKTPKGRMYYNVSTVVRYAVKCGVLQKTPCVVCGNDKNIHGHHEDYSQPLKVIWLCRTCHQKRHIQRKNIQSSQLKNL